MARNMYPGYCYRCGVYVPAGTVTLNDAGVNRETDGGLNA